MYRHLITALIALRFASAVPAEARLIELGDFAWGLPLLEVEKRAEDRGFRLREKDITGPEPRLRYEALLRGLACRLDFSFTPLGGKLYEAAVTWDGEEFGAVLKDELTAEYGLPREEIPGAGISIWTRRNTELTLRFGRGRTTLTYRHILLTRDAREEKRIVKPKPEKRSAIPDSYRGDGAEQDSDRPPALPPVTPTPPEGGD